MQKLKIVEHKEASVHSKYIFFVDEQLFALVPLLADKGYNVAKVPTFESTDQSVNKKEKDFKIHLELNSIRDKTKQKPIILITQDWDDFESFKKPAARYHIFKVKKTFLMDKLVNKIMEELKKGAGSFPDGFATNIV